MKKIMFGNSLMLLGIAIMILAGLGQSRTKKEQPKGRKRGIIKR